MSQPVRAAITGVTMYSPERIVTNAEMAKMVDTSDEWIQTRTGIRERHFAAKGQATSDMAVPAVKELLQKTNTKPEEVDLLIVATVTPDMMFPSTACLIQHKVGLKNTWGFDLIAACSSFVYALASAEQFIRTGKHRKVIVAGADVMTSITNFKDRNTCVLFGDGCGAVMLEPVPQDRELGILDTYARIDGSGAEFLDMPGGGSLNPPTHETVDKGMHYIRLEGRQVFKFAVGGMTEVSEEILARNHLKTSDIDLFVPHQANLRIIEATQKKLGLPDGKVMVTIDRFANTTSASIPTCLAVAVKEGRLKKGDLVLLTAFGAGWTSGSTLIRWAY